MNKKIITPDSPESATYRTDVKGWVGANGIFYGDKPGMENIARYAGATHKPCEECGIIIEKRYRWCPDCKEKKETAQYDALEKREWNEVGALYSMSQDKYFWSWGEVYDYLEDHPDQDLRLVICCPVPYREVEYDYWSDDLPDDTDLPDEVYRAIDNLNKALAATGPASWTPGKYAVKFTDEKRMDNHENKT